MQAQTGAHRPIAGVVVPAVIIGKGGGRLAVLGSRFALAAEDQQPARFIGAQLPERHRNAETATASEVVGVALGAGSINAAGARRDRQADAVFDGGVAASGGRRGGGLRNIEGQLEVVPGGLVVGEFHGPADLCVRVHAQLAHHAASAVVAVNSKLGHLPLQGASAVAVVLGRQRRWIHHLGANVKTIRFVRIANPCNADGGVNLGVDNGLILATTVTHGAALIHDLDPGCRLVCHHLLKPLCISSRLFTDCC